jgi:L-arabinose transport system substrate-binding protein
MIGRQQVTRHRARTTAWIAGSLIAVTALAACSSSGSGSSAGGKVAKPKFGLITQLSVGSYFVTEANGAKAEAAKLGVDLSVVDSGQDPQKDVTLAQSLITDGVQAIAVVPSNTDIGPRVFRLTDAAKIPLVASDSPLADASGKKAPFIGLDNTGSGEQVGKILAQLYQQKGWSAADTYYADIEAPTLQVCLLRTNAQVSVFSKANPSFNPSHVVKIPYDGTPGKATTSMKTAITAHPGAKHWLVTSCNDDGVVGAAKALQGTQFPAENMLGVGLGGDLACQIYTTPYLTTAIPTTTYLDAGKIGATVVETMYNIVVKKQNITGNVYVPTPQITKDDYAQAAGCK